MPATLVPQALTATKINALQYLMPRSVQRRAGFKPALNCVFAKKPTLIPLQLISWDTANHARKLGWTLKNPEHGLFP
jgi:hypothetical protein